LAVFGADTEVGKFLARLDANTPEADLREIAGPDDAERARCTELQKTVGEMQAMQAPKLRVNAEREAQEGARLRDDLASIAGLLDQGSLDAAAAREKALKEARDAAALIAHQFDAEPLGEIGSQSWRSLWEAACRYAAHVDQDLPPGHDQFLCPLCMQEVDHDARRRLQSFDRFVRDDVNAGLARLEQEKEVALANLPDMDAIRDRHQGAISLLGTRNGELGLEVLGWIQQAAETSAKVRRSDLEDLAPPSFPPDLGDWIEGRNVEANRQRAIEQSADRDTIEKECAELQARRLLGENLEATVARLVALKTVAHIESAIAKVGTRGVSNKISAFSEEFVRSGQRRPDVGP
jgi:hypothetical protein